MDFTFIIRLENIFFWYSFSSFIIPSLSNGHLTKLTSLIWENVMSMK